MTHRIPTQTWNDADRMRREAEKREGKGDLSKAMENWKKAALPAGWWWPERPYATPGETR